MFQKYLKMSDVCESRHLIEDIYRLPATEGATGRLRSFLTRITSAPADVGAGALSTVLNT